MGQDPLRYHGRNQFRTRRNWWAISHQFWNWLEPTGTGAARNWP